MTLQTLLPAFVSSIIKVFMFYRNGGIGLDANSMIFHRNKLSTSFQAPVFNFCLYLADLYFSWMTKIISGYEFGGFLFTLGWEWRVFSITWYVRLTVFSDACMKISKICCKKCCDHDLWFFINFEDAEISHKNLRINGS